MFAHRTLALYFVFAVTLAAWLVPAPAAQTAGSPIYWGAYVDGAPFDMKKLETFENNAGRKVSIVHWGQPWVMNGAFQPFREADFEKVRAHGAIPMVNWGSWLLGAGAEQPAFQLQDVYGGKYDDYIRQWAADAKAWGHPLFLRFNHEMNGWWYPWSEQKNGNRPGDYVRAWRHVHDIFTETGATNVTWVWCINRTESSQSTPIAGLYPGDAYVDWLALDAYNTGTDRAGKWKSFAEIMKHTYDEVTALAPTKPLMIAEVGTSEDGGPLGRPDSKAAWIEDMLVTQLPLHFPKVKAVVWFNWDNDEPGIDWPIESSTVSTAAFARSIASGYYATNSFARLNAAPIPALGQAPTSLKVVSRLPMIVASTS